MTTIEGEMCGDAGTPDHIRGGAYLRLERFALEWLGNHRPELTKPFPDGGLGIAPLDCGDGLREAAVTVLTVLKEIQEGLVAHRDRLGADPLDAQLANQLGRDRYYAVLALVETNTHKQAKQIQLDVMGDEPLTICSGDAFRIGTRPVRTLLTPYVAEPLRFSVYGCRRIFPDAETWSARCGRPGVRTATTSAGSRPATRSAPSSGRSTPRSGIRRFTRLRERRPP
jgi:hypothetical protein